MTVLLITLLIVLLLVCALIARSAALRSRERSSLPLGTVVYSDTGREKRSAKTLISWEYGLKGRPDYLVETKDGVIPVEIKSTALPYSGHPYEAHIMQLICYCLLCEETMDAHVPYGLIRYRDGEARVEYTAELRARLLSLLEEIRRARELPILHRNHSQARRCGGCGFRDMCGEALIHS